MYNYLQKLPTLLEETYANVPNLPKPVVYGLSYSRKYCLKVWNTHLLKDINEL